MRKVIFMVTRTIPLTLFVLFTTGLLVTVTQIHAACNIVNGKAYGDCAGVRINQGNNGYLTVRTHTSESGIINGATVLNGGELDLNGMSNGDIIVHEGARLRLTGQINGTVENLGGNVEIEGMLNHLHTTGGKVIIGGNVHSVSGSGAVSYRKGAVINGIPIEQAGGR